MLATVMPAVPVPAVYDGPRAAAADFFVQARIARALSVLPLFADGDCVSCPDGYLWLRWHSQWVMPGHAGGLSLTDGMVTAWWRRRFRPGSRFALVHRLAPNEVHRITASRYTSHFHGLSTTRGEMTYAERVTGDALRHVAARVIGCRTVSVHLELPSSIVTLHSRIVGDVFYRPDPQA